MEHKITYDPWADAYAFFWYNGKEIFEYTQEDFDQRAKDFSEKGVTMVETFSMSHFRFGYYPYWKQITEALRMLVIACHKYGIRVIEHHSSHLTPNLQKEVGWKTLKRNFAIFGNGSGMDQWFDIFPFLTLNPQIEGYNLLDFVQIDGRTGKPADTPYAAYGMCFNNETYRKIYFRYLQDVIDTGIDGIMNDDVQYFGNDNACACPTCRRLFQEQTGYTLPDPEHWDAFFENYEDPAYLAWKKFKFDSTTRFYRDLTAYYDTLGRKLERPNYSSCVLSNSQSYYSFDRCCDLWTLIMQENCNSTIIKQSYLDYYTESVHRVAAGSRYNVPSFSCFYPDREDSMYFCWALARSWGQMYNGTTEGCDVAALEKPYRNFEKRHLRLYTAPKKLSDVSFYFSKKTRDYTEDALNRYMRKFMGGIQAAYVSGLGVDMVFETDDAEELLRHGTVVLSYVAMAEDSELARFREFAQRGGRLIILGNFAEYKEDGSKRTKEELKAALGVPLVENQAVKLGAGEIWRMDFEPVESEYQPSLWATRVPDTPRNAVPSKWEQQKAGTGAVLRKIIGEPKVKVICENPRVVATGYGVDGGFALHVINLADTVAEKADTVKHGDLIPNFMKGAPKLPAMILTLNIPEVLALKTATLHTPEQQDAIALEMELQGNTARIAIPEGLFAGYGLIELE